MALPAVSTVRLSGGPYDGKDVLVVVGVLQLELPGDIDDVTRTGTYAEQRRATYARQGRRDREMTFVGWEGGRA